VRRCFTAMDAGRRGGPQGVGRNDDDRQQRSTKSPSALRVDGIQIVPGKTQIGAYPKSHKPLQPKAKARPASAPSTGRRIDPHGRGLHSQLWKGMSHYPPGPQSTHQAAYPDYKLHQEHWEQVRNASSSRQKRLIDFFHTQPV
jgi:hypothetical protein